LKETQKDAYFHFVCSISLTFLLRVLEGADYPLPGVYIKFEERKLFQLLQLKEKPKINEQLIRRCFSLCCSCHGSGFPFLGNPFFRKKKKKKNLCIIEMWMQLLSLGNCVVLT